MAKRMLSREQAIKEFASAYTRTAQQCLRAFVEGDKSTLHTSARLLRMYTDIMAGRRGKA